MSVPDEQYPHEAYLDTVFARIDRVRNIDTSVLTQRYGVDPSALSPVNGVGQPSWAVKRVLATADAQRDELREHLEGLTREYVSDGFGFDAAVMKAQETLGNPVMLAKQISRATAQDALTIKAQWVPWLKSIAPSWLVLPTLMVFIAISLGLSGVMAVACWASISVAIGLIQGYAVGITVTPDLWRLFGETSRDLEGILKLRVVRPISLRQRYNRWHLEYTAAVLSGVVGMRITSYTGNFPWRSWMFQLIVLATAVRFIGHIGSSSYLISVVLVGVSRDFGCCVGSRRRLAQSARRAS